MHANNKAAGKGKLSKDWESYFITDWVRQESKDHWEPLKWQVSLIIVLAKTVSAANYCNTFKEEREGTRGQSKRPRFNNCRLEKATISILGAEQIANWEGKGSRTSTSWERWSI